MRYIEVDSTVRVIDEYSVPAATLGSASWTFQDETSSQLFNKMREQSAPLGQQVARFATGVQSGSDKILTLTPGEAADLNIEAELLRPLLRGRDVHAYGLRQQTKLLLFPYVEVDGKFELLSESELAERFPIGYAYLLKSRAALSKRIWFGKSAEQLSGSWYGLMYVERAESFTAPHVLTPSLSARGNFSNGDGRLFATGTAGVTGLVLNTEDGIPLHILLGILNSSLIAAYMAKTSPIYQGGFHKYSSPYLKDIPIKVSRSSDDFGRMIEIGRFSKLLTDGDVHASTSIAQERGARQRLSASHRIDELVYDLYGLTADERRWVTAKTAKLGRRDS